MYDIFKYMYMYIYIICICMYTYMSIYIYVHVYVYIYIPEFMACQGVWANYSLGILYGNHKIHKHL